MNRKRSLFTQVLLAAALSAAVGLAGAQENGISTREDLETVLALKRMPCDGITDLQRQDENDYLVTCSDGHRYRIYIDAEDRVVVEERS